MRLVYTQDRAPNRPQPSNQQGEQNAILPATYAEGVLTSSSRSKIAKEITHIHCEETGAPESFVHVRFQEIKKGAQYTAGEIDDQVGVFLGMIREGRSIKERQRIIQR